MATQTKTVTELHEAGENLATFSVDREDIKQALANIPEGEAVNLVTVEYELQLLKILTAGWSISYHMNQASRKMDLAEHFWSLIRDFSKNISEVTATTTGTALDYFETLKERFNMYLQAMEGADGSDPAAVIGPLFAETCKAKDNVFVVMSGSRLFNNTVAAVKEYLDAIEIK